MTNHKLFFTGASGFIGSHFHQQVPNHQIINLDLVEPKFENTSTYVKGDIRDANDVNKVLVSKECDIIVSLAAEHKDFGIRREDYFKTNEFGTKVICEAATKYNIKKIVFYSSVAVYGNNKVPSNELLEPNPSNHYGESKLAGEKVLERWAAADKNRSVLIIRPVVVYGERNVANMYRLIDQINKGRYFHIGKGDNVKSIAYVSNLVKATLHLMKGMKSGVQIYNYADESQLNSRKIAEIIANSLNKKQLMTLPYGLVHAMGIPFDLAIKLTGKDLPISTNRIRKFCTETHHKADKIKKTGFIPEFSNEEGLVRMVDWYLKNEKRNKKQKESEVTFNYSK